MTQAIVLRGAASGAIRYGMVRFPQGAAQLSEIGALSTLGKGAVGLTLGRRIENLRAIDPTLNPTQLLASMMYVIAAEWLAENYQGPINVIGSLAGAFQVPAQPGIPAQPVWNGPAGSYVSMCSEPYQGTAPTPMYANGCGQAWLKAEPNTLPPSEADYLWASGGVWLGGTFTGDHPPVPAGQDYYWMYGIARPGTSGSTKWDQSFVGGTPGSVPREAQPGYADDIASRWREFTQANGYPDTPIPWDQVIGGAASIPSSVSSAVPNYWWLAKPVVVPVIPQRAGYPPLVVFPSRTHSQGIVIPAQPWAPAQGGAAPMPVYPPKPVVKPVEVFPPMVRPVPGVGYPARFNSMTSVRVGPLARASTGTHEVKGQVSQAVWMAMQVKGAVSEFDDLVDAVYKALPASLRKRLRAQNGKSLDTEQKMRALFQNYDRLDLEDAIMNYITAQLDDMIAAGMSSGEDQLLRELFPNFEQRMMVRQLIRAWRDGEQAPAPSTNEMYQAAKAWRDAA